MTPPHLADTRLQPSSLEARLPARVVRTLEEAEAHVEHERHSEALLCAGRLRGLGKLPGVPVARLRAVRARALWALGKVAPARAEALRAVERGASARPRAQAHRILAEHAWRNGDVEEALRQLGDEQVLADAREAPALLALRSLVLQDAGRAEEALAALDTALSTARRSGEAGDEGRLRAQRAELLGSLGRWAEAQRDVDRSAELFRERGDTRELTVAGLTRAVLEVWQGERAGARVALERVQAMTAGRSDAPRPRAEALLSLADLHFLEGEADRAEQLLREALDLFATLRDRRGECRSRLRHAHALLALGRQAEALRQAQRAARDADGTGLAVEAWGQLTLGRLWLRQDRDRAAQAFSDAARLCAGRRDLRHAANVGAALARGARPGDAELQAALDGLESFGARAILQVCRADTRELLGWELPGTARHCSARGTATRSSVCSELRVFVDAARALAGGGAFESRWAAALKAIRSELPWRRAALVAEPGLELRAELAAPRPLDARDPARRLAAGAVAPGVVVLDEQRAEDPEGVLEGLRAAAFAPVVPGSFVYADFRELACPERAVAVLGELARLLAPHLEAGWSDAPDATLPGRVPGIVGRSEAMRALCAQISRVADSSLGVHLEGETGTGKERVARALHEVSRRRARPFVAVNASSLSDELFESELFGHVRGAFSGAVMDREGYVPQAQGGTLFLDEVADLTPRGQAKLLRFLQDREYRRVGESAPRKADVRILTAANVSLAERVAAGRFRHDLLYRLTPLTLRLPPLRERPTDVPLLARHFLVESARREGRRPLGLSAEAARVLAAYAWPGNVRQLEQEMARLSLFARGDVVEPAELSPELLGASRTRPGLSLREAMLRHERELLLQTLEQNAGNRARSAVALGISRQALLLKMRRLSL